MCVIYLLSQDVHVQKDHERLILLRGEEKVASVPLYEVHSVIATKSAHLTTPLLFSLMEREIPVFYVNGRGELLGTCGAEFLRLDHQLAQQEAFRDEPRRQAFVHDIVSQKITHQRALLQAYASRRKSETLAAQAKKLKALLTSAAHASDEDALRGVEGTAARVYFSAFSEILGNKFTWKGRQQHPAREPVNALLNYGYAFLERDIRIAILGSGLDSRIGCFHADSDRRDSLVYDLMEPYRPSVIDRFVLKLLNYGTLTPEQFEKTSRSCRLTEEARTIWCEKYEAFLEKPSKSFDGMSPRALIRKEIHAFAQRVFHRDDEKIA